MQVSMRTFSIFPMSRSRPNEARRQELPDDRILHGKLVIFFLEPGAFCSVSKKRLVVVPNRSIFKIGHL